MSLSYEMVWTIIVSSWVLTFMFLRFWYVLRQYSFWKIFIYWFALLFSVASYFFWVTSGDIISNILIAGLIVSLPLSIVVTFFNKWILEARLRAEVSNVTRTRIWRTYLLLCLVAYALLLIVITSGSYYFYLTLQYWNFVLQPGVAQGALIFWALFNIAIIVSIFKNNIERVALFLPILSFITVLPLILFTPAIDAVTAMTLGVVTHLLFRK